MSFAVARSIAGPGGPNFWLKLAPWLHPVLDRFHPSDRAAPSAGTVRVEKVRVCFFQVFLAARAGGRQRTFAFRTGKQQHVCKMLFNIWQASLGSEGLGEYQDYYQRDVRTKALPISPVPLWLSLRTLVKI